MNLNQYVEYYGVYPLAYGGVPEWRDLTYQLGRLYRDRVATLPWIPADWENVVMPSMNGSGEFFMIAPSTANYPGPNGKPVYGAKFLDTLEKKKAWDEIAKMASKIQQDYAAGRVAAGRLEMERAYNNVQFWNNAVAIANLAAAPFNFVKDVANTYDKAKGLFHVAVVIGGLTAVYFYFKKR